MTYTPTDVLKMALERRNVAVRDVAEKDDEIWLVHPITAETTDASQHEMARLIGTFLDVYERYDDVGALKVYCLGPDETGYQICWYKQEWAQEAIETLGRGHPKRVVQTQELTKLLGTKEEVEFEMSLDEIESGEFVKTPPQA